MLKRLSITLMLLLAPALGLAADTRPLDWSSLPLPGLDGEPVAAGSLTGKVVLVVNTASFCGYTYQYKALEALWARYKTRGLVVLGVPTNDFGGQEPGSNESIKEFCGATFGVEFPMLAKQTVSGRAAHPFFDWVRAQTANAAEPRWNFYKYLIGRDGKLAGWYSNSVEPDDGKVIQALERALGS